MAGIYIHIPFCKTRCSYCDFYSTTQSQQIEKYINALCRELEMRKDYLGYEPVRTLYFGGGTPSQLQPESFEKVFHTLSSIYNMDECTEITIEANPDDLTPEYLNNLSRFPFNRISIGVQTFQDNMLKLLNRRHTSQQVIEVMKDVRKAGFNNVSLDLMYGLPGETITDWENDLKQIIELEPEHISAYHLIYEEDTLLHKMIKENSIHAVDDDTSTLFFSTLITMLTRAGYEHYEISNFSKPGMQSRHNSSYWDGTLYLGCGPSAHSFDGNNREWNTASLSEYIQGINNGTRISEKEELDTETKYNDLIITSLRTNKGLSLSLLRKKFDTKYLEYCLANARKHLDTGVLEIKDDYLRLTPVGIFISDGIMSDLLRV